VQKHYRDSGVTHHHVNETSFTIRDIPEILIKVPLNTLIHPSPSVYNP